MDFRTTRTAPFDVLIMMIALGKWTQYVMPAFILPWRCHLPFMNMKPDSFFFCNATLDNPDVLSNSLDTIRRSSRSNPLHKRQEIMSFTEIVLGYLL